MPKYERDPDGVNIIQGILRRLNALEQHNPLLNARYDRTDLIVGLDRRIEALMPSGKTGAYYGRLYQDDTGDLIYGFAVLDDSGHSLWTAYRKDVPGSLGQVYSSTDYFTALAAIQVYLQRGLYRIQMDSGIFLQRDSNPDGGTSLFEIDSTGHIFVQYSFGSGSPNLLTVDGNGISVQAAQGTLKFPGMTSTGSAANLFIDLATGSVFRSTSSIGYKQDIGEHDTESDADKILQAHIVEFRVTEEVNEQDDLAPTYVGLIAEDLDELGLNWYVVYDEYNEPDAIEYERLTLPLIALAQRQQKEIDDLKARVEALEAKVNGS